MGCRLQGGAAPSHLPDPSPQGHGMGLGSASATHLLDGPATLNHLTDPSGRLLATTRVSLFSNTVDF